MKGLKNLKGLLAAVFMAVIVAPLTWAQQPLTVSGRVVDSMGEPIIGVSILEKGTSNGAISNIDGEYRLSVKSGATLVFSFIGYATQEKKATGPTLNVTLQDDTQLLEEVVVVGYGVQKKSSVTGSISKVDGSEMMNRTITSAQDALGGKTAGVQIISSSGAPGDASTIRVRGYSSNYDSDPLYIVDGLKVEDISTIDANDIESIEVLKDGASAAVYGAEAGNGVVLVTTKRAKKGAAKVSYDFQISFNSLSNKPEVMNAQEYMTYQLEGGALTQSQIDAYYDGVTDTDWFDGTTETSLTQKHTLSFSSASDRGSVFLSLGYYKNDGFLKGDQDTHKRYNLTANAELKPKKWLTVGTNTRISYGEMNTLPWADSYVGSANGPFTSMMALDPLTPVYFDSDNIPSFVATYIDEGRKVITDDKGRYYGISPWVLSLNPLAYLDVNHYNLTSTSVNSTFYANFNLFDGFVFTTRLGIDLRSVDTYNYNETYYAASNLCNDNPSITQATTNKYYYQWENFANYTKTFAKKHTIGAMLGMSFSKTVNKTVSATIDSITQDLENFAYLAYASDDATKTVDGEKTITSKLSYFGRVNYSYADRYMIEATMRADANDLSVLSKSQRWGYFPGASVGWVASNEAFFPETSAWTYAKVRGSWGRNGSISNLGDFAYASAIESGTSYSIDGTTTYSVGSAPTTLGNDNLKWETTDQWDFGVDLRFLGDRLSFSADYFYKKTKDLLISDSSPSLTAGNDPSPINAGDVVNKGFEFELSWKHNIGKFNYSINGNLSFLKNEVTYLEPTVTRLSGFYAAGMTYFTYFEQGQPIWYMRGYKVDHIDQSTGEPVFVDVDGDGELSANDVDYIGSGVPDVTYGITLNASYKNFDLVIFGSGAAGGDIFCNLNNIYNQCDNKLKIYYDERWTSTNTNAKRPRPVCDNEYEYIMSDANVFSGNYFKIKQIQLGYTVPKTLTKKIGIDNIRAYISLDDFFCFSSYPGMDPEIASSNATTAIGIDNAAYPSAKKVVLGFNVTF